MQVTFKGIPHPPPTPEQLDEWKAQCLSKFPSKIQYQVILADPPWTYKSKGTSVRGKPPYPTMPLKELKALPVPSIAASTCVLFLWATCPLLPDALELIKGWGFTYKTVFKVWLKRTSNGKTSVGPGWWSRPSVELLLCATKGHGALTWKQTCSEKQEHPSSRGSHSQKPAELRDAISRFMNVERRIELFARTPAPDFDVWGLEIPEFFQPRAPSP